MLKTAFCPGEILLPACPLSTWSVVACDQYTSQPEYWQKVEEIASGNPCAGDLIFPEAFFDQVDFNEKIQQINESMSRYLEEDLFREIPDSMIYIERTLHDGSIRKGLLGLLDLELYDYRHGAETPIRATEETVLARIPARVKIRENAPLEMPHVIVLIDDPQKTVIEPLEAQKNSCEKLYDFDLMMNSGHIRGWRITGGLCDTVSEALEKLADPAAFAERYHMPEAAPLVYAVGDGNHSLAAARECWENIREFLTPEERETHPARFTLVELVNLREDSLRFEGIHRAVRVPDPDDLLHEFQKYAESRRGNFPKQKVRIFLKKREISVVIPHPERALASGTVQDFLDNYLDTCPGWIDYIHGEDVLRDLAAEKGAVGILLPAIEREEFFQTILREGTLPRKTFSIGEASDKRFYLECRRLR